MAKKKVLTEEEQRILLCKEEIAKYNQGVPIEEINLSIIKDKDIFGNVANFELWFAWCKTHG